MLTASARAAIGETGPLAHVAGRALATAGTRLAEALGPNPAGWRYSAVHRIMDQHPIARANPATASLFGAPATPVGGSGHSICLMTPDQRGQVVEGAPWRFVAELAPSGPRLRDVLRHGSSAHPLSPHYDDQTEAHTAGRHFEVPLVGTRQGWRVLHLIPAGRRYRGRHE